MKRILYAILLSGILSCTALAGYVGYICPAGARQDSTREFIAGGRELKNIKGVIIDEDTSLDYIAVVSVKPVPNGLFYIQKPAQKKYVDQWIRALFLGDPTPILPEDTTGWDVKNCYLQEVDKLTPLEREMLVRGFYTRPDPLQSSPSIAQKVVITLKIAPDAPAGLHTIRFTAADNRPMIFNPIPFFIGNLPETQEPFMLPPPEKPAIPIVTLPAVMNGQILPGETDQFIFSGHKGDVWSFKVYGRALLPFIGDGVPGHFQPILQIMDYQGEEVAFQDDTYFNPDPTLNFTVPADGNYTLSIRDALFRGREDFVYRIEATQGAEPYRLLPGPGWQLPKVTMDLGQDRMKAPFPAVMQGTILPGQKHRIAVSLTKGTDAIFEVWARRSLSPLDSMLRIFGPDGKILAANDDFPRPKVGTTYHHADSYIHLTTQQSGTYTIEISDAANAGGDDYRYWLRMDVPRPDFRVWSVPSGIELPSDGGAFPVGFVLERLDGHSGDITLMLADSQDITIAGSRVIPYGNKRENSFESVCGSQAPFPDCAKEFLTLAVLRQGKPRMASLKLLAQSGDVIHPVIPADESMQAFAYNHLIEAGKCWAAIVNRNSLKFTWAFDATETKKVTPGQEFELKASIKGKMADDNCSAELFSPPAGLTLIDCQTSQNGVTLRLKADPAMKQSRFNQVIRLDYSMESFDKNTKSAKKQKHSTYLPAIMIQITTN